MKTPALAMLCLLVAGCMRHQPTAVPVQVINTQVDLSQCPASIDDQAAQPLSPPGNQAPGLCAALSINGYPVPDPNCTPGAINPTLTLAVLQNPNFRTGCVRNNLTSEQQKETTYAWYSLVKPTPNSGQAQVCELDHLVPLYFGGADSLDNIWPQCGPSAATLNARYFKQKDKVELFLGNEVRAGRMSLSDAQNGVATNWTQYLPAANQACKVGGCPDLRNAAEIE